MLTAVTVVIRLQLTKELIKLFNSNNSNSAKHLIKKTEASIIKVGILFAVLFGVAFNILKLSFGKLNIVHLNIVIFIAVLTFLLVTHRSYLKATLDFKKLAINTNFQALSRLLITIPLIYFGLKLNGALLGITVSYLLTLFLIYKQTDIKNVFNTRDKLAIKFNIVSKDSALTMLGFLGLTSLVSTDLLLVQNYLPNHAGFYAALMLFGKIIIFSTTPISSVLFPSIVNSTKQKSKKIFLLSILVTTYFGVVILTLYHLFPNLIISTLLSDTYVIISPYLFKYSLFIFLYSFVYIFVNGFIALDDYRPAVLTFSIAFLQFVGILIFHNNIMQIISVSLYLTLLLSVIIFIYFIKYYYGKECSSFKVRAN